MKPVVRAFALALAASAVHGALAQSAPSSALKNAPAGAAPTAPATPPAFSSRYGAPAAAPGGAVAQPAAAPPVPGKALLPAQKSDAAPANTAGTNAPAADLFKMDDRAIIIVGGKSRPAGEVKREIKAELQRLSGPPKTVRVSRATAARTQQVMSRPGSAPIAAKPMTGALPAAAKAERYAAGISPLDAPARRLGREAVADSKSVCNTRPPKVTRVRGALTPNQRFTIDGMCFGETAGAVEVIGQFPGGNMKLVFERWSESEIVAFVPAVRGAADHAVALTVVRADRKRAPAAQANFVAERERVEVPGRYWSPSEHFSHIDVVRGGGSAFGSYTSHSLSAGSFATPFTLSINKACALDEAAWTSTIGRVDAFDGWEQGPPHEARVSVVWTPRCTTHATDYVLAGSSQRVCSVAFHLKAWASCPAGVLP